MKIFKKVNFPILKLNIATKNCANFKKTLKTYTKDLRKISNLCQDQACRKYVILSTYCRHMKCQDILSIRGIEIFNVCYFIRAYGILWVTKRKVFFVLPQPIYLSNPQSGYLDVDAYLLNLVSHALTSNCHTIFTIVTL